MKIIIEGLIARVQRDQKVTLCHYLWMGNHPHIIVVARDSVQCTRFYGELQKQLTEAIKNLLGISSLSLWKSNGTSVVRYGDLDGIKERIAYLYANPARGNLVDRIELYPGVSTWKAFVDTKNSLKALHKELCPWVRAPMIFKLPRRALSFVQDRAYADKLVESVKKSHLLELYPNAWMEGFGISEELDIKQVNDGIIFILKEYEEASRVTRKKKGRKTKGANRLRTEALSLDYKSKGSTVRIFVYAASAKIRVRMIEAYKKFCDRCDDCYEKWRTGDFKVDWPPGAFPPAPPPLANYFYA